MTTATLVTTPDPDDRPARPSLHPADAGRFVAHTSTLTARDFRAVRGDNAIFRLLTDPPESTTS